MNMTKIFEERLKIVSHFLGHIKKILYICNRYIILFLSFTTQVLIFL